MIRTGTIFIHNNPFVSSEIVDYKESYKETGADLYNTPQTPNRYPWNSYHCGATVYIPQYDENTLPQGGGYEYLAAEITFDYDDEKRVCIGRNTEYREINGKNYWGYTWYLLGTEGHISPTVKCITHGTTKLGMTLPSSEWFVPWGGPFGKYYVANNVLDRPRSDGWLVSNNFYYHLWFISDITAIWGLNDEIYNWTMSGAAGAGSDTWVSNRNYIPDADTMANPTSDGSALPIYTLKNNIHLYPTRQQAFDNNQLFGSCLNKTNNEKYLNDLAGIRELTQGKPYYYVQNGRVNTRYTTASQKPFDRNGYVFQEKPIENMKIKPLVEISRQIQNNIFRTGTGGSGGQVSDGNPLILGIPYFSNLDLAEQYVQGWDPEPEINPGKFIFNLDLTYDS
jgi:hypothetical protein